MFRGYEGADEEDTRMLKGQALSNTMGTKICQSSDGVRRWQVLEATSAYLRPGLDPETISHRKYYVQMVNNGVCRELSYYNFILRLQ